MSETNQNYLTHPKGIMSWLLTLDHKRIGLMYLFGGLFFFFVGGLIGWVARDYMMNYREIPRPHPEMFDINGNLVPDEIVAFRFESNYDNDEEEDTSD